MSLFFSFFCPKHFDFEDFLYNWKEEEINVHAIKKNPHIFLSFLPSLDPLSSQTQLLNYKIFNALIVI